MPNQHLCSVLYFILLTLNNKVNLIFYDNLGCMVSANNETNVVVFWLFLPSVVALCLLSSCCFFCQISYLLSFVLPMMKLSKSIHYMEYELMIKNL